MLFNTVIEFDTYMIHNIGTSTSCLLLLLLLFMIHSTLSTIANMTAQNHIITSSTAVITAVIIEFRIVNAFIPSSTINTDINRCRTVVTTSTITVVVIITTITTIAINTIIIIITSTRLLLRLLKTFFNIAVSTNPIITTFTTAIISTICATSNGRSSATTNLTVIMVGINI